MTFCMAARVAEGIVGLADTRITTGREATMARKVVTHTRTGNTMFLMTSGLRSVRDKALTYFDETLEESASFDRLYKAVNSLAEQVRRVAQEDKASLTESGFRFDVSALVGGQFEGDEEPKLYLLYPQGNWVEVSFATPYFIIGESQYGKPLADRALTWESSLQDTLKISFLAFDATKTSSTDVDFPVDIVIYRRDSFQIVEHRLTRDDLQEPARWWQEHVKAGVAQVPSEWMNPIFAKLGGGIRRVDKGA